VQATILGLFKFLGMLEIDPKPPMLLNFFLPVLFGEIDDINLTKLSAAAMLTPLFL
jgi:hypothetical protein